MLPSVDSVEGGAGGVHRIKPDGSGYQSIIVSGIGKRGITGFTLDWIAGMVV